MRGERKNLLEGVAGRTQEMRNHRINRAQTKGTGEGESPHDGALESEFGENLLSRRKTSVRSEYNSNRRKG
jgi:hypothetical protein